MVKQIELEIRGTTFVANLIEEKAPITCKTILSILPFEGDGIHQSWSGPALMIHSPILSQAIKEHGGENAISYRVFVKGEVSELLQRLMII